MSWIWSSAPPEDETGETTANPYASTTFGTSSLSSNPSPTASAPSDAFGTAFSDDVDLTPPENESSNSFDDYLASNPTPTTDFSGLPTDPMSDANSSPLNFSTLNRIDPSVLSSRPGFQPNTGVDYVFADDYKEVRKKGPGEQLTFLVGSSFFGGSLLGASMGLTSAIPASAGKPMRVRVNAILNAVAKRGTSLGNSCSVLALAFSLSETALYNYTRDETLSNYALAGAMAGAFFKSTRGLRTAGIWGAGGAALALSTVYATRQGYYGRGLQGVL